MKILIADSDESQLQAYKDKAVELFKDIHNSKGPVHIQYCSTGSEVVSLLSYNKYDLTIMDRALSRVPGDTIITLNRPNLGKIIICSVFTNTTEVCVPKPIDYDKLRNAIKEACDVPAASSSQAVSEYEAI